MARQVPVDASLQWDVDLLILDYLVYDATHAVLDFAHDTPQPSPALYNLKNQLQLVQAQSELTAQHDADPPTPLPEDVRFRLRLLQFSSIYVLRHHADADITSPASLAALRTANAARAAQWHESAGSGALPGYSNDNPLGAPDADDSDANDDRAIPAHAQLLDLLPSFMHLTAARSQMAAGVEAGPEWTITPMWQALAVDFMAQAVVEKRRQGRGGMSSPSAADMRAVIGEAFAWGEPGGQDGSAAPGSPRHSHPQPHSALHPYQNGASPLADLFTDHDPTNPWRTIYAAALASVRNAADYDDDTTPPASQASTCFHARLRSFLASLHHSLPAPLLAQLELCGGDGARGDGGALMLDGVVLGAGDVRGLLDAVGAG